MMEMKIDKIFRVQAYSWAHLMLKNSVFIVGANKTGKTWAYMPQICSLVAQQLMQIKIQDRKKTSGPVAVIMVASARHVEYVANTCELLLAGVKRHINLNIVRSYGIFETQQVKMDLLNGCGMLIATVPSLERLIQDDTEMQALLNVTRLKHIVVDDLDDMRSRNKVATEQVLRKLLICTQKQRPQLVVITRHWEKSLVFFLKYSLKPLLLFGDFLEAAVYGRVSLHIKLCAQENKMETIVEFLKEHPSEQQFCLIFCNTTEEVNTVVAKLQENGEKCVVYDDRSNIEAVNIPSRWQKGLISGVLVSMDTAFCDADIKNAHNLIHYSMPDTWTKFTKRFACLANNHVNILLNSKEKSKGNPEDTKTQSLILLDGENNEQLPRLFDFLRQHNRHELIHQNMLTVCENVKGTREQIKVLNRVPLCNYLLEFGNCEKLHCLQRHLLSDYDADNDLPSTGELQIHILKIHTVTHYSARLLRHKSIGENKWVNVRRSNEFTVFNMQLNMFYGQSKNKVPFWPLEVNTICVYRNSKNYQRAVILEIPTLKHRDVIQNVSVKVHLIDRGISVTDVASNSLLVCEPKFKDFPAQAVNIRVQDIIPLDNERTWDVFTTNQVQKWLVESLTKQQVVQVSVNGAFANTIWAKAVVVMEHLATINQYVYHLNLRTMLLEKKYAMLKPYKTTIDSMLEESIKKNITNLVNEENENESELNNFKAPMDKENGKSNYLNFEKLKINNIDSKLRIPAEGEQENEKNNNLDFETERGETQIQKTDSAKQISFVEKWTELRMNEFSLVELGNESNNGHWNSILVQITDPLEKETFKNLSQFINEQIAAQKSKSTIKILDLCWFTVGRCCVVKHAGSHYLRAKIVDIMNRNEENRKVRFFLCDFAAFVTKDLNVALYDDFLYETNKEIIEFTPYQAVHCTLAGIQIRDLASEYYFVEKEYLHALALNERKKTESSDVFQFLNINSYEIVLYESDEDVANENASMLNKALVDYGFATLRQASLLNLKMEDYLKKAETKPEADEENCESEDENYYDKIKEITNLLENQQEKVKKPENNKNMQNLKKIVDVEHERTQENNKNSDPEISEQHNGICVLKPLYKHPQVIWHQSDYFIFITIHAPDVKDFYLKINKNTVFYCAEINGEREMCILNLLDTIVPDKSWHELVGLNLKLRLLKTQFMMWPRLLEACHKFSWLKYELDKVEAMENISLARSFYCISGYLPDDLKNNNQDDSDSESEGFGDITANIYKDDEADPFQD